MLTKGVWGDYAAEAQMPTGIRRREGATPSIAVSNLYLALNPKEDE